MTTTSQARYCAGCGRVITACNGFVKVGDLLEAEAGQRLYSDVRELCGWCVNTKQWTAEGKLIPQERKESEMTTSQATEALLKALRAFTIVRNVRETHVGPEWAAGHHCKICHEAWKYDAEERHTAECPFTLALQPPPAHVTINHDGFSGDVIGSYTTREGKRGIVVQQDDTRVVHVYREDRALASAGEGTTYTFKDVPLGNPNAPLLQISRADFPAHAPDVVEIKKVDPWRRPADAFATIEAMREALRRLDRTICQVKQGLKPEYILTVNELDRAALDMALVNARHVCGLSSTTIQRMDGSGEE